MKPAVAPGSLFHQRFRAIGTTWRRRYNVTRILLREALMRRLALLVCLSLGSVYAQQSPVSEIRYRSIPDLLKPPADLYFGEVTGVALNSKGHIFVFSRGNTTGPAYAASAAQLLEFDRDGKFLREIGHNLY